MRFVETPLPGAWVDRARAARRRARLVRAHLRRRASSRARGLNPAVVQCNASFNARARHAARHALPGRAARRVQARALRARRDLRRRRRPARRLADAIARWHGVELSAENRARLLHPGRARARLSDAHRRLRGALPDGPCRTCPRRRAACAGTTRRSASTGPPPTASGRSPSATAPSRDFRWMSALVARSPLSRAGRRTPTTCPLCGGTGAARASRRPTSTARRASERVQLRALRVAARALYLANAPDDLSPVLPVGATTSLPSAARARSPGANRRRRIDLLRERGGLRPARRDRRRVRACSRRAARNAGFDVTAIEMDARACAYLRDVAGVDAIKSA